MVFQFRRRVLSASPVIVPAAYATGDVIGGLITLPSFFIENRGQSLIKSLFVTDAANQKASIDLYLFNAIPVTSIGADNAAFALANADLPKLVGRLSILTADYVTAKAATNAEACYKNLDLLVEGAQGSQTIYIAAISRGTPTYAGAADLTFKLGIEQ